MQEEQTTEDIQKVGCMEALDEPYPPTALMAIVKKRELADHTLAVIGFLRILLWQTLHLYDYSPYFVLIGFTVAMALVAWCCGVRSPAMRRRICVLVVTLFRGPKLYPERAFASILPLHGVIRSLVSKGSL